MLLAALLLALAAWLTSGRDVQPEKPDLQVNLPTQMEKTDWARFERRQVLPAPVLKTEEPPKGRAAVRDPLLRAMPSKVTHGAVVAEANALRNSELGDLLIQCVFGGDDGELLSRMKDAGFDALQDLDRVAVADGTLMVTGNFGKTNWNALGMSDQQPWGDQGRTVDLQSPDGGFAMPLGMWGNQMVVLGDSRDDVKAALDRIEGRGPDQDAPIVDPSKSYGEIYGVLMSEPLAQAFEESNPALATALRSASQKMELHVDASHDVGLVADFDGSDLSKSDELRKVMGAALSVAKIQARNANEPEAAELLERARVMGANGQGFRLETGLPYAMVQQSLQDCVKRRKSERAKRLAANDGG